MNQSKILETENLMFAMQQRNLVYNYNFLNYSNAEYVNGELIYNHPDGWLYADHGSNGQISFDPTTNACMIIKSKGDDIMSLKQNVNEFPRWKESLCGKQVSGCAEVLVTGVKECELTFSIDDGINSSAVTIKVIADEEKKISVSLDVSARATNLIVSLESSTSDAVIFVKKIYTNIGSIALENLPCMIEGFIGERKQYMSMEIPPVNELSLCNEGIELFGVYTRLDSFLNGKFGRGKNGNSMLPDMRGYFSRAWNNQADVDPDAAGRTALGEGSVTGDNVGTIQQDLIKEHDHELNFDLSGQIPAGTSATMPSINKVPKSRTVNFGGSETRSKNISELYTIKWA